MKINIYHPISNKGELVKTDSVIEIKRNRWIDSSGTSHPMLYFKPIAFSDKYVYYLTLFGKADCNNGRHISLTFFQNIQFKWLQRDQFLQKADNKKWLITTAIAVVALLLSLYNTFNN